MTIAYLVPGSGGRFYCENCLRDLPLIQALRQQGLEVIMVPLYLPLIDQEHGGINPSMAREHTQLFFGAISYYLHHRYPRLARVTRWLHPLLDSGPLLRLAARFSASTEARGLESMTLEMLGGLQITGETEFQVLLTYLQKLAPNVIHLSNALLAGLGRALKAALPSVLTVTLQDEDVWLDAMPEPWRSRAYEQLQASAQFVDHYFPVSSYFATRLNQNAPLPPTLQTVVAPGIDTQRYGKLPTTPHPPAIGYLYRLSESYGLDILAETYLRLVEVPGLDNLQLHIAGGYTRRDLPFVKKIKKLLHNRIVSGHVIFYDDFIFNQRQRLFAAIDLFCVPLRQAEAFGTYLLEALASGVPVVQPAIGAFEEIVALSGGGAVYTPAEGPFDCLKTLLLNPAEARRLGSLGQQNCTKLYDSLVVAKKMQQIWQSLTTEGSHAEN